MGWCLWLDDQAGKPDMPGRQPPNDGRDWKIAQSSKQAIKLVALHGLPDFMDLDHDLGQPSDRSSLDDTMFFLHWLNWKFPDSIKTLTWNCHSRNPDMNKKMDSFLDSWKRGLDL